MKKKKRTKEKPVTLLWVLSLMVFCISLNFDNFAVFLISGGSTLFFLGIETHRELKEDK